MVDAGPLCDEHVKPGEVYTLFRPVLRAEIVLFRLLTRNPGLLHALCIPRLGGPNRFSNY